MYKDKIIDSEIWSLKAEITRKNEEIFMIKSDYEKLVLQVKFFHQNIVAK